MSDPIAVALIASVIGPLLVFAFSARKGDLERLEKRVEALENDKRSLTDYAHELRAHIDDEKPPPPPPWPKGLTR